MNKVYFLQWFNERWNNIGTMSVDVDSLSIPEPFSAQTSYDDHAICDSRLHVANYSVRPFRVCGGHVVRAVMVDDNSVAPILCCSGFRPADNGLCFVKRRAVSWSVFDDKILIAGPPPHEECCEFSRAHVQFRKAISLINRFDMIYAPRAAITRADKR